MIDSAWGPFLFDTSSESWLGRQRSEAVQIWWSGYLARHQVHVSAATVIERVRGYGLLWRACPESDRARIEKARLAYLRQGRHVWPIDAAVAVIAGEIIALVPNPPTPPVRGHKAAESRVDRLARWRFDVIIAATAIARNIRLVHNNPGDFEAIREAMEWEPVRFPGLGPLSLVRCGSLIPEQADCSMIGTCG